MQQDLREYHSKQGNIHLGSARLGSPGLPVGGGVGAVNGEEPPAMDCLVVVEHRAQLVAVEGAVGEGALVVALSVLQVEVPLKAERVVEDAKAGVAVPAQPAPVGGLQVRPQVLSVWSV